MVRKPRQPISVAAQAEIARRVAASRPAALVELESVVRARGGVVTAPQLEAVARLLAATVPAADFVGVFVGWLAAVGVSTETAAPYLDSPEWPALRVAALAAEHGDGEPPAAPFIAEIRDTFAIDDAEAAVLNLHLLVSRSRRRALDRAAEGATPGAVGRPKGARPWEAAGMSETTWRRRLKQQKVEENRKVADTIANVSQNGGKFVSIGDEPGAGDGASVQAESGPESRSISIRVRHEFSATGSAMLTYFPAYEPPPPVAPPVRTAPLYDSIAARSQIHDTSEARKLAVLARQIGLIKADMPEPPWAETWYDRPDGLALTADQEQALALAVRLANLGQERAERIRLRRERRQAETEHTMPQAEQDTLAAARVAEQDARRDAAARGDCPAGVPPAVWAAVPEASRPAVRARAGYHAMRGYTRLAAVEYAAAEIAQSLREDAEEQARIAAIVAAVVTAAPATDPALAERAAGVHWRLATADAVPAVLAELAAPEWRPWRGIDDLRARFAVAVESAQPPVPVADHALVAQVAADLWAEWPDKRRRGEAWVVSDAQEFISWCRKHGEPVAVGAARTIPALPWLRS